MTKTALEATASSSGNNNNKSVRNVKNLPDESPHRGASPNWACAMKLGEFRKVPIPKVITNRTCQTASQSDP